jgi:hypothetical protein
MEDGMEIDGDRVHFIHTSCMTEAHIGLLNKDPNIQWIWKKD